MDFNHDLTTLDPLEDGARPNGEDQLYSLGISSQLNAEITEFVPAQLAARYKTAIEARVHALAGLLGEPRTKDNHDGEGGVTARHDAGNDEASTDEGGDIGGTDVGGDSAGGNTAGSDADDVAGDTMGGQSLDHEAGIEAGAEEATITAGNEGNPTEMTEQSAAQRLASWTLRIPEDLSEESSPFAPIYTRSLH